MTWGEKYLKKLGMRILVLSNILLIIYAFYMTDLWKKDKILLFESTKTINLRLDPIERVLKEIAKNQFVGIGNSDLMEIINKIKIKDYKNMDDKIEELQKTGMKPYFVSTNDQDSRNE